MSSSILLVKNRLKISPALLVAAASAESPCSELWIYLYEITENPILKEWKKRMLISGMNKFYLEKANYYT
jgi:hypothetical protein